ncbi:MAG TPA: hypothetical protein VGM94_14685 [Galbitalea sp.]
MKARARIGATAALAIAGALLLAACGGPPIAAPPPPTESQIVSLMSAWPAYEAGVIGSDSPADLENVTFIRFVPDAAWYQTLGRCTQAQRERGDVADDICLVQYPPESVRDRLKTRAQLNYIYSYYVGELMPCIRAHGFVPKAPAARAAFLTMSRNGLTLWNPYSTIGLHDPGFEATALGAPGLAGSSSSGLAQLAGSILSPRLVALLSQCPALPAGV